MVPPSYVCWFKTTSRYNYMYAYHTLLLYIVIIVMFTNLAQYDFVGHLHIIGKSSPNGKFLPLLSILNSGKPLWKPNKKHQPKGGFDGSIARSARSGVHRGQIMLSQKFKVETFAGAFGERRSARVTLFVSEIMWNLGLNEILMFFFNCF